MDISGINWAVFALGVFAVLLLAWTLVARRAKAGPAAGFVSLAHLSVAGLNSAAPVRGYLDPDYVGYGFGFAQADAGLAVTVVAGAIWLLAATAGFLALARNRLAMLFVLLVSTLFAVNLGYPLVRDQLQGKLPIVQLGEYLTIPGLLAMVLILAILVLPFLFATVWSASRLFRPR